VELVDLLLGEIPEHQTGVSTSAATESTDSRVAVCTIDAYVKLCNAKGYLRLQIHAVLYIGFTDILTVFQPLNKIINLGLVYSVMFLPAFPGVMGMLSRK